MSRFLSREAGRLAPYTPGEQPTDAQYIKLNTNESPFPPSPKVVKAISRAELLKLDLYPDPTCGTLHRAIAAYYGLKPENVLAANGSDEVLAFAFQAFFDPDREVVFPRITYSFYPVYTSYFGLKCRRVPMNPDFSDPVDELCGNNGGVVLCNPNAPTGIAVGLDVVEKLLRANPDVVVIVDEAYVDFGARSAVPLIDTYPNLLVVQTASKSRALAGLRVGWAMGQENLISGLRCVRDSINSYTVDRVAQAGARAAIEDEDYFQSIRRRVMDTRERTAKVLKQMGFIVLPSQANFLFLSHPNHGGKELLDALRERGILVRWWSDPPIENWLRVTIGTDEEMEEFARGLREIVS